MRWTSALFIGLATSSMSFNSLRPPLDRELNALPGWELHPPAADAKPISTKERLRALYPVASRIEDKKAPGGLGGCNNYSFELGEKKWGTKGEVALIAFPEEKVAYFKYLGIALRIINRTDKDVAFAAFDSMTYIVQEAMDEQGRWREIESAPDIHAFCGNSFHRVFLEPERYWQVPVRTYDGPFKTKIRFRLDPTSEPGEEPSIYSNEIDGAIHLNQFRTGPNRAKLGKALHSKRAEPEVLATLVEALTDDDSRVRCSAAWRLGEFKGEAKTAVDQLKSAMKDGDESLRAEAAAALVKVGEQPKYCIAVLASVVAGRDLAARRSAIFHLRRMGSLAQEAVPALCNALLRESDEGLRCNILEALAKIRFNPKRCIPVIVRTLTDSEWLVRSKAADSLGEFGEEGKSAIQALKERLSDSNGHVRVASAGALWRLSGCVEPSVGVLISCLALREQVDYVPSSAAETLGKIGNPAKDSVPFLNKLLRDERAGRCTRISAAGALWRITKMAGPPMDVFMKELEDPKLIFESDSSHMFEILGEMGPSANTATPALRKLLRNESGELREAAAALLKRIEE